MTAALLWSAVVGKTALMCDVPALGFLIHDFNEEINSSLFVGGSLRRCNDCS
jgi:hypothetical protein